VLEKNGFALEKTVADVFELPENKTGVKGKKAGMTIMRWQRPT